TLTGQPQPPLIYDYYGFPPESYTIHYPAMGDPALAKSIQKKIAAEGIEAALTDQRGFDHGLFIPLKLLYPNADIPCIQLSLLNNLNHEEHIKLGKDLQFLVSQNVLVIGSGFSFHNLNAFFRQELAGADLQNEQFHRWLEETLCNPELAESERQRRLINWENT